MHDANTRALWLAISLLAATLVAAGTASLCFVNGKDSASVAIAGGSAFAGTMILALAILQFLAGSAR